MRLIPPVYLTGREVSLLVFSRASRSNVVATNASSIRNTHARNKFTLQSSVTATTYFPLYKTGPSLPDTLLCCCFSAMWLEEGTEV